MIWLVPGLLGAGCAVALWVAAQSRDADATYLALVLCNVWAMANMLWLMNQLWALPALDCYAGYVAKKIWWHRRNRDAAILVHLVIVRLACHAVDTLTGHDFLVTYIWVLNISFALQLFVIIFWGGRIGQFLDLGADCLRRLGRALLPSAALGRLNNGR